MHSRIMITTKIIMKESQHYNNHITTTLGKITSHEQELKKKRVGKSRVTKWGERKTESRQECDVRNVLIG